jgi:hypothetical protein
MITVRCDHCENVIDGVVYTVLVQRVEQIPECSGRRVQLHWKCIIPYHIAEIGLQDWVTDCPGCGCAVPFHFGRDGVVTSATRRAGMGGKDETAQERR